VTPAPANVKAPNTIATMTESGDKTILTHIDELLAEEKKLRTDHLGHGLTGVDRERLQHLEVELDQAWDLLRQRRAKSEAGEDPESARERPSGEVEGYLQ
jgi:hypothetical protein